MSSTTFALSDLLAATSLGHVKASTFMSGTHVFNIAEENVKACVDRRPYSLHPSQSSSKKTHQLCHEGP